jgi:hypothetical protein
LRAEAPSFGDEPREALPGGLPLFMARTLRVDDRVAELRAAGFSDIEHEMIRDEAVFDTAAIRALYGSFSIMRDVAPDRERVGRRRPTMRSSETSPSLQAARTDLL